MMEVATMTVGMDKMHDGLILIFGYQLTRVSWKLAVKCACVYVSVDRFKNRDDVVVLSIHWGGNWEYQVDKRHRKFAHAAIKSAGVDIIYGHSSHHARG